MGLFAIEWNQFISDVIKPTGNGRAHLGPRAVQFPDQSAMPQDVVRLIEYFLAVMSCLCITLIALALVRDL